MKGPIHEMAQGTPLDLVAVLDESLAPAITTGGAIPWELWDRALVGIARDVLSRPGKRFRARLVELAYELAGGCAGELAPTVPALVELVHAGSLVVDDVEDDARERRGAPALHRRYGVPLAINTGNWLYFAAYHVVEHAGFAEATPLDVYRRLSRTMFRSHQGQALDLAIDVTELRQRDIPGLADAVATLKTGELMSFAAALGALAARATEPVVALLTRFGAVLGVALQHLDDLGALCSVRRRDKGREDLAARRLTWPWGHLARELDEVRFAALQRELRHASGSAALDAVATKLAGLLGDSALHGARARLAAARALLTEPFAGHPALTKIESEMLRLEQGHA
jgi:geranylgeranyl pyrophosphate synthase